MKEKDNVFRTSIAAAEFEAVYQEINDLKTQIKDLQTVVNANKDVLKGAAIPIHKN